MTAVINELLAPIHAKFATEASLKGLRERAYPVEKKQKKKGGNKPVATVDISRLDIRVGKIVEVRLFNELHSRWLADMYTDCK